MAETKKNYFNRVRFDYSLQIKTLNQPVLNEIKKKKTLLKYEYTKQSAASNISLSAYNLL